MSPSTTPPPPEILIIGAGVLALTTATLLQQRHPYTPITLIAAEFPSPSPMSASSPSPSISTPAYASMWAGAHYRPIPVIPSTHPSFHFLPTATQLFHLQLARESAWARTTAEHMKVLATSMPEAGVQIVQGEEYLEDPPPQNLLLRSGDVYASAGDDFRVWSGEEVNVLNENIGKARASGSGSGSGSSSEADGNTATGKVKWAASYQTYIVNPHIYTAHLLSTFTANGGRTIQKRLNHITDVLSLTPDPSNIDRQTIIINHSGTGLLSDPSDPSTTLIRGQTLLVRTPYHKTITRQCADGSWSFLIPRPLGGGTVIGGTKQVGDTFGLPRGEERNALLGAARRWFPEFVINEEEEIVCDNVGFRPARVGGVRIEREVLSKDRNGDGDGNVTVVHGYGAGGRGYEISVGVAGEVCELVEGCLNGLQREQGRGQGREEQGANGNVKAKL